MLADRGSRITRPLPGASADDADSLSGGLWRTARGGLTVRSHACRYLIDGTDWKDETP
jgi:hypothetical protein